MVFIEFSQKYVVLQFIVIIISEVLLPANSLTIQPNPNVNLSMKDIVEKNGYPIHFYNDIETDDGYLLTLQRIPHGKKPLSHRKKRPVVFLMHGIVCTAETFTFSSPEKGLAYILADKGYDVWLGNARGTQFSRKHKYLNADTDKDFWKYSFHEIGFYDLSTMIDYVLEKTNVTKLTYIGHSQGTSAFFVMASRKPKYNQKITAMLALAPVAFMSHIKGRIIKILSKHYKAIQKTLTSMNMFELIPFRKILWESSKNLCSKNTFFENVCAVMLFLVTGFDFADLDRSLISVLLSRTPDDLSLQQLVHYAQLITSAKFQHFDYGKSLNYEKYGKDTPPSYNLSKISIPIALFYGKNDFIVSEKDVDILADKLPNVEDKYLIPFKYFSHMDFFMTKHVHKHFIRRLLKFLNKYAIS